MLQAYPGGSKDSIEAYIVFVDIHERGRNTHDRDIVKYEEVKSAGDYEVIEGPITDEILNEWSLFWPIDGYGFHMVRLRTSIEKRDAFCRKASRRIDCFRQSYMPPACLY